MLAEVEVLTQLVNVRRQQRKLPLLVAHPILTIEANFRALELALFELNGSEEEPPPESRYKLASDRNGWGKSEDVFGTGYPSPQAALIDWEKDEDAKDILFNENYLFCGVGLAEFPNPYGLFPNSRYWLIICASELDEA